MSDLLISMRAIHESSTLTDALAAAVRGRRLESPRAALFVVDGTTLQEWPVDGVPPVDSGPVRAEGREAGFLADVLRTGETMSMDGTNGQSAPMLPGCRLDGGRLRLPFVLHGRPVAVLYADEGTDGQPLASWLETVQILGSHATSVVASLTRFEQPQAMGPHRQPIGAARQRCHCSGRAAPADTNGRRSERTTVREAARLRDKLYKRRGGSCRARAAHLRARLGGGRSIARGGFTISVSLGPSWDETRTFKQELVQTLADGDQSLFE